MNNFSAPAKIFHWLSAFMVLGLLIAGFWMGGLSVSPLKLQIYGLHKSFGLAVLGLTVLRLGWRFYAGVPGALPSHSAVERRAAKLVHVVLYVSLFCMPLSGWLMSSAGGFPAPFFGLFMLPPLVAKNEILFDLFREIHEIVAYVLMGAVASHWAGALKHHLFDRDETLARMGGNLLLAVLGGLLLLGAGGVALLEEFGEEGDDGHAVQTVPAPAAESEQNEETGAFHWMIEPESSAIGVVFAQSGEPVSASFGAWSGDIDFDPDHPGQGHVRVTIDMASFKTGSADRDAQAQSADWFDVAAYPQAVFESESFERLEANRYRVSGFLTLRGVRVPLAFPFTLAIAVEEAGVQRALMEAHLSLNRLDFGVGQGAWHATDTIGGAVAVALKLVAHRRS